MERNENNTTRMPTLDEASRSVLRHFMEKVAKELEMDIPSEEILANDLRHLWAALNTLGVLTPQTDGIIGDTIKDAQHLVALAKNHLNNHSLTLSVPDEATQISMVKHGKVMWAMTELETALPSDAAKKVNSLKNRVSDELGAIIREAGTFVDVKPS